MIRQVDVKQKDKVQAPTFFRYLPILILGMMVCCFVLLDAVLSLQYLRFNDALLTRLGRWPLLPVHILFPRYEVLSSYMDRRIPLPLAIDRGWKETAILFAAFSAVFLVYIVALRNLAQRVTLRYLLISTAILGSICVVFASLLSGDIFSYIAYARMEVIYHINPLVYGPWFIGKDNVYHYVYWFDQPSIYGPTWVFLTGSIQWLLLQCGFSGLVSIVLSLRIFGLAMHLSSVALVWSLIGLLQQRYGFVSTEKRVFATLAFAWNPLLLLEACVNAHVDSTILFVVLLVIWFLLRSTTAKYPLPFLIAVGALLAIGACLKLNVGLFVPGLLLYLWFQRDRVRNILTFIGVFLVVMVLLYAPFWQQGALLHTFLNAPALARNINTPADFFANLYNGIVYSFVHATFMHTPGHLFIVSPAEQVAHLLSLGAFALAFVYMCWYAIRVPERINTIPALIRWFAILWLLYSVLGSPWFWPWYLVVFFGLFALVEGTTDRRVWFVGPFRLPLMVRLLTFSSITLYCFFSWAATSSFAPGLYFFYWSDFCGLYMWLLPICSLRLRIPLRRRETSPAITNKLVATRWVQMRSFLSKGI